MNKTLKESEERWQFAVEGNGDGLFDWNVETNEIFFSKQWKSMLGYNDDEIENKFEEWDKRLHPDDKAAAHEAVKNHIDGITDIYSNEHRLLCKDGSYKWILAKGKIISRTEKNKPSQLIGTHRDITEQKQSEYLIQESEEKYRALFDNAPLSYQSLDEQGRFIDVNPSWLRTLGYERDEVIGKFYADFLHPDWKVHFEKNFPAFKKRGYVNDVQFKIKHKKGHFIDISFEGCIGYLPDGSFKQTYCVFQDITERKKTEQLLAYGEEKYRQLYESNLMPISIFDTETLEFLSVNNAFVKKYGYTEEEFLKMTILDIRPDTETPKLKQSVSTIDNGLTNAGVFLHKKKNGEIIYVEIIRYDLVFEGKNAKLVFANDITDRLQAEEKLKESEEKFRTFVNTASDLMCITNKDGQLTDVNSAMVDILDYSIEELKEMHISSLLTEQALKNDFESNWEKFVEDGKIKIETTFKTKNGNEISGELKATAIYNSSGKIIGTRAVFTDFTERKQAEAALLESEEKFRLAFKTSPDSVNINRLEDGLYVDINDSFTQITGYTREETIGKTSNEINIWTNLEDRTHLVKGLKKSGKVENLEAKFKLKDNRIIDGLMSAAVISINNVPHILSITRDISNLKHTEIELKKQKEMFELVINSVPTRIFWKDLNSVYLGCNRAFAEAVGSQTIEAIIGKNDYDLIWAAEAEKYIADDKQVTKSGVPKLGYEEYYTLPNNKKVWWHSSKMPLKDSSGKIFGILATSEDVTERKEFLKALQERNAYIESILENMPIGFALNTINDGDVKYMNNNFEKIYGWSRGILTNTNIFFEKVFPEAEYREMMQAQIIADMESGDPERMNWNDLKIVTSTGEERYVHAFNIPLIEQNLMISTVQDTTKRKIAEDELIKHRNHLEELIKARTTELEEKYAELERINKLFVGRELKMVELKEKIKVLESKLN